MPDPKRQKLVSAPERVGKFVVEQKLCDGTFGPIYRARQEPLNRVAVLKVLTADKADPETVKRFLRDARVAIRLKHRNVVGLHDVGKCPTLGVEFIALEHLEGGSLRELMEGEGPVSEERAYELCLGIARALTCAEGEGVVHRDLRPENVFLTGAGEAKVGGFRFAQQEGLEPLGDDSQEIGSSDYASPELWQGRAVGARADIFSLGVILFELLTGRTPFDGPAGAAVANSIPEPGVSPAATILVQGMCNPDPEARYASSRDALRDLQRALSKRTPVGPLGEPSGDTSTSFAQKTYREAAGRPIEITVEREGRVLARQVLDQDSIAIGRSTGCDVTVDNPIVSRRHAEVRREGLTLAVAPLSKTNSTAVNGEEIRERTLLSPGDVILLSERIEVRAEFLSDPGEEMPTHEFSIPTPRAPTSSTGCLVYLREGREERLELERSIQIGRLDACDVRLGAESPRKAALIVPSAEEGPVLFNVASAASAVLLNGEPVEDQVVLSDGDVILVCGQSMRFFGRRA